MYARSIFVGLFIALFLTSSAVFGQCSCGVPAATYAPAVSSYTAEYGPVTAYYAPSSYSTYYAPTTTYSAPTTSVSYYMPTTTYYAPQPYVSYYAPTTAYYAPQPYVSCYAPSVSYYAPTTAYYAPTPYVTARPYAWVGSSVYGTPKVYVAGQPVRNAIRANSW
jgi:hypothetical protein